MHLQIFDYTNVGILFSMKNSYPTHHIKQKLKLEIFQIFFQEV